MLGCGGSSTGIALSAQCAGIPLRRSLSVHLDGPGAPAASLPGASSTGIVLRAMFRNSVEEVLTCGCRSSRPVQMYMYLYLGTFGLAWSSCSHSQMCQNTQFCRARYHQQQRLVKCQSIICHSNNASLAQHQHKWLSPT